jgi:hypothetical protein
MRAARRQYNHSRSSSRFSRNQLTAHRRLRQLALYVRGTRKYSNRRMFQIPLNPEFAPRTERWQ